MMLLQARDHWDCPRLGGREESPRTLALRAPTSVWAPGFGGLTEITWNQPGEVAELQAGAPGRALGIPACASFPQGSGFGSSLVPGIPVASSLGTSPVPPPSITRSTQAESEGWWFGAERASSGTICWVSAELLALPGVAHPAASASTSVVPAAWPTAVAPWGEQLTPSPPVVCPLEVPPKPHVKSPS